MGEEKLTTTSQELQMLDSFLLYSSTTASQKWHFWSSIAQLVERQTENPGALLIRVRFLCAAKDCSPSLLPLQTLYL